MSKSILMPQVGQDLEEGRLVEWRVKVGDKVAKGDIVAVVESEKASFEVEAFETGMVTELLYSEGDVTKVLAPLLYVNDPDESEPLRTSNAAAPPVSVPSTPAPAAVPETSQAANDAGQLPVDAAAVVESAADLSVGQVAGAPEPVMKPGRSSPLARRIGGISGIDLSRVLGTGPGGAVVRRDIDKALQVRMLEDGRASAIAAPAAARPAPPGNAQGLHRVWLRNGTGHPVVMIHGFGGDHNAWRVLVAGAALSRPILAIDLPGHGQSAGSAANLQDMATAVAATLVDEGVMAADLVGHSLGAAVAVVVAEAARFTVRSLFLLSPAGLGPDINGDFLAGFCRARTETTLAPWMALLVSDLAGIGPAFIRITAETRALPGVAEGQEQVARNLFPDGTQVFSIRTALEGLAMPIRIVFGSADRIIPVRHLAGLSGMIAQHVFPGVGHMPQIEAREPVARLLLEHLHVAD